MYFPVGPFMLLDDDDSFEDFIDMLPAGYYFPRCSQEQPNADKML